MTLRQTVILEENNTIFSFLTILFLQLIFLASILFKIFTLFFSEEIASFSTLFLILILMFSRIKNIQAEPQIIIQKKTRKKMMYVDYLYLPLPFFSSFKVEKINQSIVKQVNQFESIYLMNNSIHILIEIYGNYIITDNNKFNNLGGQAKFAYNCLKKFKANIIDYHKYCSSFTQQELDKATQETIEQIQNEFGVEFFEITKLQANFQ